VRDVLFVLACVAVGGFVAVLAVLGMIGAPVGFDEAYVAQSPWNLALGNGYASFDWQFGDGYRPFDTLTSTGPAVLLPVAAVFAVFGVGVVQLRATMLVFLALLVAATFLVGRRVAGRWAGLVAVVAVLALDLRYDFPYTATWSLVDGLGELPAAAFLLTGALLLRRSKTGAAVLVGVAALCKLVAFLAVPAFLAVILLTPGEPVRRRIRNAVVFGLWAISPTVLWEAVKLVVLGPTEYLESLLAYGSFVLHSGSGIAPTGLVHDLFSRSGYLLGAFHLPWWGAFASLLVLLAATALAIVTRFRSGGPVRRDPRFAVVVAGAGTVALFLLWWIVISESFFARHSFPGLLLAAPLLAVGGCAGLAILLRAGGWRRVVAVLVALAWLPVVGWQTVGQLGDVTSAPAYSRADQQAVAAWLVENAPDGVQHIDYWQNPELRLLSLVDSEPYPTGSGPLVLSPQMRDLAPELFATSVALCDDILYDEDDFIVCATRP
jgi:hypothetical protein